jgi:hypothetical protein
MTSLAAPAVSGDRAQHSEHDWTDREARDRAERSDPSAPRADTTPNQTTPVDRPGRPTLATR